MPANMISAPVGSSLTVSGRSIATVSAGPTPGSTPTKVPSVTPMRPHSRFMGCSATAKPCSSACSASISDSRAAEEWREPPRGQVDVEQLYEEHEHAQRQGRSDQEISYWFPAAKTARHANEQRRPGDDETRRTDEQHVREEARADPQKGPGREAAGLLAALAPAAAECLESESGPQQQQPRRDYGGDEVGTVAGVAALAG